HSLIQFIVTDGFDRFYRYNFTIDQLISKLFKSGDDEGRLFSMLKNCFQKSLVRLTVTATKCCLSFVCSTITAENANLELFVLSTAEARVEIKKLLFDFTEKCTEMKTEFQFQSIIGEKSPLDKNNRLRGKNVAAPPMKARKRATGLQYN
uniref:Uncharacterized protein n=1 Tax=Romanomermis culicivorax TaxID=13658 RepID=A0A915ITJ9_ROMCU